MTIEQEREKTAAGVDPNTQLIEIPKHPTPTQEAADFNPPAPREKAEVQGLREQNFNQRANRHLRWKYARWVFCYLVCYSLFTAALLLISGFKAHTGFDMQPEVLNFLVGSTAAAAIGLVAAVVTGLFRPT